MSKKIFIYLTFLLSILIFTVAQEFSIAEDFPYRDKGGGMTQIDPPDPRLQERANLAQEKANLELNIKDLENILNSEYTQNNPVIRDTINDNLTNAKKRLGEVN